MKERLNICNEVHEGKLSSWCLDFGSTSHVCSDKIIFIEIYKDSPKNILKLAAENQTTSKNILGRVKIDVDEKHMFLQPFKIYCQLQK